MDGGIDERRRFAALALEPREQRQEQQKQEKIWMCESHQSELSGFMCAAEFHFLFFRQLDLGLWFGFLHKAQGGAVEVVQLGLTRFVLGEFDQVAALEKFPQTFFLVGRKQIGFAEFIKKFFGRALGSVEIEALFKVPANGI